MNSSLVRLTALESRAASQTLLAVGTKRKRGRWICPECREGRAVQQRRAFGHGARFPTRQSTFAPIGIYAGEERWTQQQREVKKDEALQPRLPHRQEASKSQELDSSWADSDLAEEEVGEDEGTLSSVSSEPMRDAKIDSSLLNIDYVAMLPYGLLNNEPDIIARSLAAAGEANDLEFIQNIPRTTFAECIRLLQPSNFTEPLASAHLEVSRAVSDRMGMSPIRQVAWQHAQVLRNILVTRRNAGVAVGLDEYKMLLRAAQDLGYRRMATELWDSLLKDGHTPDTACYNYMMAATVFNDMHQPLARHKYRVTEFNQQRRSGTRFLGPYFGNYRIGGRLGLRKQVTEIFNDMLKHGAAADEHSYRNVIVAAAREGDLALVKSVLRKVWGVDVDVLMEGKADASSPAMANGEATALKPTSELLFALAHAYSINNDIPTALRVVDHIARRFQVDITMNIWRQLFEYTFVLACKRSGAQSRTSGSKTGGLPLQSVLSLWETMTSAPYNVQPTMGMYNQLIRNLQQRDSPWAMLEHMQNGYQISMQSLMQASQAYTALKEAANGPFKIGSLEGMRREWERLQVIRWRNLFWLKRWVRLLLSTLGSSVHEASGPDLALRKIPRLLWDWRRYAPTLVRYDTLGGMVEFHIRTNEEIETAKKLGQAEDRQRELVREKVPLFVETSWPRRESQQSRGWRKVSSRTNRSDDESTKSIEPGG